MEYLFLDKHKKFLLKLVLLFSLPFFTLTLSNRFDYFPILLGCLLSFVIGIILFKKVQIEDKVSIKKIVLSLCLAIYSLKYLMLYFNNNVHAFNNLLQKVINRQVNYYLLVQLIALCALPVFTFIIKRFIDYFYPRVKSFLESLSKPEKRYLIIITLIGIFSSIAISWLTTAFIKPIHNGNVVDYDVIYTSDTGFLSRDDSYFNVSCYENDIRQPLFGVFALPFSIPAKILSSFVFLGNTNLAYEIALSMLQFVLLALSIIMLARLIKIENKDKKYFYLLFTCSMPFLFFSLILEQYTISLFYLILALYVYYENKKTDTNYYYVSAVGTLIVSGVLLPFITKNKSISKILLSIIKCFVVFAFIFIISGQLPQLFDLFKHLNSLLNRYADKITLSDKFNQFTAFSKGLFIANPGHLKLIDGIPTYQLYEYTSVNILGIIVLAICLLGYLLNHKEKMAKIAIGWVTFSFIILFVVGWGTQENGLVLYSLYFFWAYIILYYYFIRKIFRNNVAFKIFVILSCLIMFVFNMLEFSKLLDFAMKFY